MADTQTISRKRKTGVYAYALDWHRLGLLALAGAAAAKYIDPVLLAAVLPAAAKQVFTDVTRGAVAVYAANFQLAQRAQNMADLERMANEGKFNEDKSE